MKNKLLIILAVLVILSFIGCQGGSGSQGQQVRVPNFGKDPSYAIGLNFGTNLKQGMDMDEVYPDIDELLQGMRDGLTGNEPRFDLDEAYNIFQAAQMELMQSRNEEAIQKEAAFLAENAQNPGVMVTPSGLQYEIIVEGDGRKPPSYGVVRVHYEGTLIDGFVFDSSYYYEPVEFSLNRVIPGWTEGIQLMNVGSTFKFYIPSELAYGEYGSPPQIPPYSPLIFTVELLDILSD